MDLSAYNRIAILGGSGSGKSTLARNIAAMTGHPVIYLDYEKFFPGWVELSREEAMEKHAQWLLGERWIIEGGGFYGTMESRYAAADLAIFLDLPRVLRLFRVIRRLRQPRPELRPGVKQSDATLNEHFAALWRILRHCRREHVLALHEQYPQVKFIRLTTRKAVRNFAAELK
ncbi:MAG: hypothetical protein FWB76_07755 [Oscillospiraceae bacterium]|nr:hypothetical protein [Oscillospiraceae bacterium]